MNTYNLADEIDLLDIIKTLPAAEGRQIDETTACFDYIDKDNDIVPVVVLKIGRQQLGVYGRVGWPRNCLMSGLLQQMHGIIRTRRVAPSHAGWKTISSLGLD